MYLDFENIKKEFTNIKTAFNEKMLSFKGSI